MKKTMIATLLTLLITTGASFAAGIGYVDYAKVRAEYPLAKKYAQDIDNKANSIKTYADAQQKKAIDAKTPAEKKAIADASVKEIRARQQQYAQMLNKYETELTQKVVASDEKVRVAKGLDIIITKTTRVTGGVDCTAEVLKNLK